MTRVSANASTKLSAGVSHRDGGSLPEVCAAGACTAAATAEPSGSIELCPCIVSNTLRRRREQASRLSTLGRIDRVTAGHGAHDDDVLNLVLVDRVRIVREEHEVRELARCDRSLDRLLMGGIGPVDGEDSQRLINADALVGTPSFAVPPFASHHSLHAHERSERSWAEVRAGR